MNIQKLASAKSKLVVGHKIRSWMTDRNPAPLGIGEVTREYGTERGVNSQLKEELAREHVKDLENKHKAKKEARALDKDFFLSVLHSSATKRDARSYIQKFTPPKATTLKKNHVAQRNSCGVNLGSFYGPAAVEESPKFMQHPAKAAKLIEELHLHIALVKIRAPQTLSGDIIDGIGKTLSQLGRLGLVSVVVVDCNVEDGPPTTTSTQGPKWRAMEADQANRIVTAIDNNGEKGARLVDNVVGISETPTQLDRISTRVHITLRKLLMTPLRRGVIPVIPCVGYTDVTQNAQTVSASDIILALTREFAGLPSGLSPDEDPILVQERMCALKEEVSLDRLIILDPLGGIPASNRENGYHVFLNMEQEFESAKMDLLNNSQRTARGLNPNHLEREEMSDLALGNPFSKFVETEFENPHPTTQKTSRSGQQEVENWHHIQNLQLTRGVLSMLPPTSSALLTTPEEAANSGRDSKFQPARVGTRRQRNPLIHNLLTDKPVFSSSLPMGRLGQISERVAPARNITPTTFVKHGLSVTIFPDPTLAPWEPPIKGKPRLSLTSSQIDLPRLVHLIEDSFGRKLDVQAYLDRVNDRIAGVIVAGEYEGGALLTWETPLGVLDDGSPESRARMVPYLDKFAVLRRSQGNGGVADLIFKAMVRDCFPNGVVWRSRKTNPVNKWYFERSRGTWKLPNTGWTMFWTTPELTLDKQLFHDYEGVCRMIEPSWADNKAVLD